MVVAVGLGERAGTIAATAEAAGVSKGGLLYHFASKTALVAGLEGLGLATGVLSGLLGVGGGVVVVPAMILLFGYSDLLAKGTSMLMMIPTAISGTIGNLRRNNVDLPAAALIGVAACTTTALGAWIATLLDPLAANILFAVFIVFIAMLIAARRLFDGLPLTVHLVTWGFLAALVVTIVLFWPVGYFNLTALELVAFGLIFGWIVVFIRFETAAADGAPAVEHA